MRVLVSTEETQGERGNDFCFVPEGELLVFSVVECGDEEIDGSCGCRRSMCGSLCRKATTTMRVEDRPDMTLEGLAALVYAAHEAGGWHAGSDAEEQQENWAWARVEALRLAAAAAIFEPGTVVERRGDGLIPRA